MLKQTKKNYWVLPSLSRQKGVVHAFSDRTFDDCNPKRKTKQNWPNIEKFLAVLDHARSNLVLMEQVHGNRIKVVNKNHRGEVIPGVDGLVTTARGVILGVNTADCLPLLFYDPVAGVIGAAHAGWKGVLAKIPQKMIAVMIRLSSLPEDILVGIGPHVGGCCYNVDAGRIKRFYKAFGPVAGMIKNKNFLDLSAPAKMQLVHSGILAKNIENSSVCTSCQNKDFFSQRKDKPETYGGQLGVIKQ